MAGSHLRPSVVQAREKLAEGRKKALDQHTSGCPGIQVCAFLTDILDTVILDLYHAALAESGDGTDDLVALVPNGGYGRRDVAPFSDVDLMILIEPGSQDRVATFVRTLQNGIYDSGLQMGPSVRTPADACSQAFADATIFTSLAESRLLSGNAELFHTMMTRFRRQATRRSSALIQKIEASRREERRQFGETVYLLEPNVKRSRGGLRDLQLLRWVGFARYGEAEPDNLQRSGWLSKQDRMKLREAREFLLRLRNELHFHAGKSQDLLSKSEQIRLSKSLGFPGTESQRPVEQFMREYIEHTSDVRYIVTHFLESAKPSYGISHVIDPLFSHQVSGDFRVGPMHIGATKKGVVKVRNDLAETLRLMDLSNQYKVRIDRPTWQAVREAMSNRPSLEISPQAAQRFLSLLSQSGRLGTLLRRLHELRVLEQLVPPMAHARCLMQFNDYHKYTVDEHSIRAVECATRFLDDEETLGEAYRGVRDKRLLHLALLMHDLGKGFPEDHCDVGARLALETGPLLGLSDKETETLRFLIQQHLLMSNLAQRRDTTDDSVVVQFAVEVGSPDVLQMLYVLTCADLAAVGPGVLSKWKSDLLAQLYLRTRERLAGDRLASTTDQWLQSRQEQLKQLVEKYDDAAWWNQQIALLPRSYFLAAESPQAILAELESLKSLPHHDVAAWGRYLPQRNAVEYTIGAYEEIVPGIFHRLTGALTSKGMQILSAEIHTLADGLVLDRFNVLDMDYNGEPPPERIAEVTAALQQALKTTTETPPSFRRLWADKAAQPNEESVMPTRVSIDNSTSDQYMILDIFAHDSLGLLYTITRTIFDLGLSVHVAKIGTHLDQVVDVFYVTDHENQTIFAEERIEEIRTRLLEEIEQHAGQES